MDASGLGRQQRQTTCCLEEICLSAITLVYLVVDRLDKLRAMKIERSWERGNRSEGTNHPTPAVRRLIDAMRRDPDDLGGHVIGAKHYFNCITLGIVSRECVPLIHLLTIKQLRARPVPSASLRQTYYTFWAIRFRRRPPPRRPTLIQDSSKPRVLRRPP